jgi:uncharacterized membrane-anchored protein
MRTALMWLAGAFVFANFYAMISEKQALLHRGRTVYLELAPVDPRSMMQGDYMELNYAVMNRLNMDHFNSSEPQSPSGTIIVQVDPRNVGTFARYDDGRPLAPNEARVKYHHTGWRAVIGAESYFIPEGSGQIFGQAAYGEIKLEPDGTALIAALCDKNLQPIVAPPIITTR